MKRACLADCEREQRVSDPLVHLSLVVGQCLGSSCCSEVGTALEKTKSIRPSHHEPARITLTSGPAHEGSCRSQQCLHGNKMRRRQGRELMEIVRIRPLVVASASGIQPKPPTLHEPDFSHTGHIPVTEQRCTKHKMRTPLAPFGEKKHTL